MVGNVPTRTAMFAGKDFSSRILESNGYQRSCAREGVAGFCSGLPEALVTTPFQVVKVRMQSKELVQFYRNDFDCLVKVLSEEGTMALFTGLSTTVIRNSVWNGIYFGAIAKLSDWSGPGPDGLAGEIQNLVTGLCAGIVATLFDAPLDVVKSRIQESRPTARRTLPATLIELSREGGIPALYKGFVPKAWRMGIGGAVGFVTFEFVHRRLEKAMSGAPDLGAVPDSITTKDEYETCLGQLSFRDGLPDDDTVQKVYDNLDRSRGVSAFLDMVPLASLEAMRRGLVENGMDAANKVMIFETLMDCSSLFLTGNTDTVYATGLLNLQRDGPTVIEMPPSVGPCTVDDAFFRFVTDMGGPGPDRGAGGKYLILPPGYKGSTPEGYYIATSPTYTNWFVGRGFLREGKPDHAAAEWRDKLKVYPLSASGNPPKMEYLNISGRVMNTIHANDFSFFEEVNAVIQYEPIDFLEPELRGNLAAIGIMKGKPFQPDERMKALLTEAAVIGNATSRAISFAPRDKPEIYENSEWQSLFQGGDYHWLSHGGAGGRNKDARTRFFYVATVNSAAMILKMVGVGSQYAMASRDSEHKYLDGAKTYTLTLPPNVPAKDFWSLVVYDTQTRSMLKTKQLFPSRNSVAHAAEIKQSPDGSTTVWFAPSAPPGHEGNWIQTVPGKMWFLLLRLYGPLEPWFDKTWRPGEIVEVVEPEDFVEASVLVWTLVAPELPSCLRSLEAPPVHSVEVCEEELSGDVYATG
ncbi:unnamed protein product [Symbiodinium necroappetens]|uniref:Uncharacterized protein n=1 Tax=Symbiodinium necroappetens TaxID=1628268 RepID=A0A813AVK7_9DINO|nr:unnamed protein product [Symbiodinium necroappetens]